MVSWSDPKRGEPCNVIVVRDYGYKVPCAQLRPCPIHGRKPVPADEAPWPEDASANREKDQSE